MSKRTISPPPEPDSDRNKTVQTNLELRGNFIPFFNGMRDLEIVFGGPAGTGKTRVILERQHFIQRKYPRARGLIVRKFRSSMNETVLDTFRNEVIRDSAGDLYPDAPHWRERDQKFEYDNGSEIIVAGMDDPGKIMSSKYDWFYWNEAIEAKRSEWDAIMSRLRNFVVPYQQAIGDTNPGPPTHWIRQFGIEKKLTFLETTHKDNPVYWNAKLNKWTEKGNIYVNKILGQALTGILRKRLYLGEWVLAEGQVYDTFDHTVHVIPRFQPPRHWPHFWVFDFGYIDPFVWHDWVLDPDTGILYHYRELYHSQITVNEACAIIRDAGWIDPPMALICDHDAEDRATLEKEFGMLTLTAYKSISPGIQAVQKRLKVDPILGKPRVFFMDDAGIRLDSKLRERHHPVSTISEVDNYVWDTKKMDLDKYKDSPVDKYNHGMDAWRYMIAFLDDVATDPQEFTGVVSGRDIFEDDDMEHYLNTMISPF